jgi:hypothetical protein
MKFPRTIHGLLRFGLPIVSTTSPEQQHAVDTWSLSQAEKFPRLLDLREENDETLQVQYHSQFSLPHQLLVDDVEQGVHQVRSHDRFVDSTILNDDDHSRQVD